MRQRHIILPFAENGEQTSVADQLDPSGIVTYEQGYGPDYQRDQTTDPLAKPVERLQWNSILNDITNTIKAYQEQTFPEFILPENNNGTAFPYSAGAVVNWSADGNPPFSQYVSLVNNNTELPSNITNWSPLYVSNANIRGLIDAIFVGTIQSFLCTTPPAPFIPLDGRIILRAQYPLLTAHILSSGNTVTESVWQSDITNRAHFSLGDGSTTIRLPDTRGWHKRDADNGRGIDAGRTVGTYQADEFASHYHGGRYFLTASSGGSLYVLRAYPNQTGTDLPQVTQNSGGVETRGKNYAVLTCIYAA